MELYGFRRLGILITSNVNHFKDLKTFMVLLHPQFKTMTTKILQKFLCLCSTEESLRKLVWTYVAISSGSSPGNPSNIFHFYQASTIKYKTMNKWPCALHRALFIPSPGPPKRPLTAAYSDSCTLIKLPDRASYPLSSNILLCKVSSRWYL